MNRNRVIIAAVLHFGFLFSNAQKVEPRGFIVRGRIEGTENGTRVYLVDIDAQSVLDSTRTNSGRFKLKGRVETPTNCWIRCQNETVPIMVENTAMTFYSTQTNMNLSSETEGGKEQELQNELRALQRPYDTVWMPAMDSIINNQFVDAEHKKRLGQRYNENQPLSQHVCIEFGKRHPNSFLGLDILYRNRQTIGKDLTEALLAQMSGPVKASGKAQALTVFARNELAQTGKPLIDFDAKTIDGTPFRLSSLKGKYILLSFWNAGCIPCRFENKTLSKQYERLKEKLVIVSFSTSKNKAAWLKASGDDGIQWANISDLAGEDSKVKALYDVQAEPASFLINKDGIILKKIDGFYPDFTADLEKLIKQN